MNRLSAAEVVDRMLEDFSNTGPAPAGSPDDPWRAKGGIKKLHFKANDFIGKRPVGNGLTKTKPTAHPDRFKWKPPVT